MKLTKKERKVLRGPNAMVQKSLRDGEEIQVGKNTYKGKLPQFTRVGHQVLKIGKGLPFVKVA